jgi:hypothetical protein
MSMEDYTPDLEFDDEAPPAKRHKVRSYTLIFFNVLTKRFL